jgi:UDP-GlcNAc:undecaprenyl-phosphate/decaprenyl-phosphate GlcNAc-1-phosphate transferase
MKGVAMKYALVRHFFASGFSFLLSFYLIPAIIKSSRKFGIMDVPDGKIKCHEIPIPYLGGVAIYLAFIATLCLVYPFENRILWLLLGSTLLLFVGLIDDLKVLRPGQKFLGQIVAVVCFLKGGFWLKTDFMLSFFNMFLSAFWMLSVINAFNLGYVMDGLSATIAIISGVSFFIIALLFKQYAISLLLTSFLGAILAFLFYNKPSAKIYMGDAGSMFVGGFLAAIPLLISWSSWSINAYYTPVVILAVPLLEIFFLVVIRTWLGIPFYKGSPHHFSIYLQKKGWSKNKVLIFTAIVSVLFSLVGFLFLLDIIDFAVMFGLLVGLFFGWVYFIFG